MKVITFILGVLLTIGGFYCFFAPAATYLSLAPVLAVVMIIEGIGKLVMWFKLKGEGDSNGWLLASAIISILLGIVILGSIWTALAFDFLIVCMAAAWIIVSGISNLATALRMRKAQKAGLPVSGSWVTTLVLAIIMILAGIVCLFNPAILAITIGLMLGIVIITSGISMIALAFA